MCQRKYFSPLNHIMTSRYSYTNYTGNPYIHYHGIPYNENINDQLPSNNSNRSIIRSNQMPSDTSYVTITPNARNDPEIDTWSKSMRKDNLYNKYNNRC
nr:hypothetical protein [Megavirus caiporensis]